MNIVMWVKIFLKLLNILFVIVYMLDYQYNNYWL